MAMTSVTRSSRRVEGIHRHPHVVVSSTRSHQPLPNNRDSSTIHHGPDANRAKRYLAASEGELDAVRQKKQRISVEIPSRLPAHHGESAATSTNGTTTKSNSAVPTVANLHHDSSTPPTAANPSLTKHKEKVVNGLKHELGRLNLPEPEACPKDQGRKLRSQEATRFKSELAAYFPDYDEIIGNDPRETHLLNLDTPIVITESPAQPSQHGASQNGIFPVRGFGDALFTDLLDAQRLDLGFLEARHNKDRPPQDPLPDAFYEPSHRKAERLERSIRNSEKGRAQHERDQIARLLDGLQGHDWLRVMGVSGITESKKKAFEPARAHFVRGCQAILDKFRTWAAEEKRRKLEKERAAAEAEAEGEAEAEDEGEEDEGEDEKEEDEIEVESAGRPASLDARTSEGADLSDVDASIAKQLREEALAAARTSSRKTKTTGPPSSASGPSQPAAASSPPPQEITSFFRKRYQRESALSKGRRRGRTVLAWGQPIPDLAEADFCLPEGLLDEDTRRAHARQKRRDRRGKQQA